MFALAEVRIPLGFDVRGRERGNEVGRVFYGDEILTGRLKEAGAPSGYNIWRDTGPTFQKCQ